MAEVSLSVDPILGGAAATIAGAVSWYLRQLTKDRRAQREQREREIQVLAELKAAVVALPSFIAALAAVEAALEALRRQFEDRTNWMLRERRPTPLGDDVPEEIDPELTPAPGLREARARARTPPGGVGALRGGRYHKRGGRDPSDS